MVHFKINYTFTRTGVHMRVQYASGSVVELLTRSSGCGAVALRCGLEQDA